MKTAYQITAFVWLEEQLSAMESEKQRKDLEDNVNNILEKYLEQVEEKYRQTGSVIFTDCKTVKQIP